MKRVCFLLNNDFTFDNRVKREAYSLAEAGYMVLLLCVASKDKPLHEQHGHLYIHRIFHKRLYKYHFFSWRFLKSLLKTIVAVRACDFVHVHDANMLLTGFCLARLWRSKLIYDSHELWSELFNEEKVRLLNAKKKLKPKALADKLQQLDWSMKFENWALSRADAVITVSHSIGNFLRGQAKRPIFHLEIILNTPHYNNIRKTNLLREEYNLHPHTKILVYQGMMAEKRGLIPLIEAVELINQELTNHVALVLIGPIFPSDQDFYNLLYQRITASPHLRGSVFFKACLPLESMMRYLASADLGVHPLQNVHQSYYYSLPNKLFECIQAGIPIAASNFPEIRKILEQYGIGFVFNAADPNDIARTINDYFNSPDLQTVYQENNHRARAELNWEIQEEKLLRLYQMLGGIQSPLVLSESLAREKALALK